MFYIQLYGDTPIILQLEMRRGRDPCLRVAQMEVAELQLKPLLSDSRFLALTLHHLSLQKTQLWAHSQAKGQLHT